MALDPIGTIELEAARIRAAYERDREGRVPWSDRWTVRSVARHVGHAHHVVAQVVRDRPTAAFGLFETTEFPPKDDPAFVAWSAAATDALCRTLSETPLDEACWTTHPTDATVRYWFRHMAHETLIHRWDAEAGAGLVPAPIDPDLAADGIDEYLHLYVPVGRRLHGSPAGPTVRIACTDAAGEWYLQLAPDGGSSVSASPIDHAASLVGPAAELLLGLWRRQALVSDGGEVLLTGDRDLLARHDELLPPL